MSQVVEKRGERDYATLPPAPPPPPPLPNYLLTNNQVECVKPSAYCDGDEDGSVDLENAVKRVSNVETNCHTFFSSYTHLKSQLQDGPKCGLVALSIATTKTNNFKSVDELFDYAVEMGLTSIGEMYSCKDMMELVKHATNFDVKIICGGLKCHIDCILHYLSTGGLMLVPYDADRNHSPCSNKGHTAHWAVMNGVVIFADTAEADAVAIDPYPRCSCTFEWGAGRKLSEDVLVSVEGTRAVLKKGSCRGDEEPRPGKMYLTGRQGKSRHLALWSLENLAESNANLTKLSEKQENLGFVLSEGGVGEGLRGKALLLR